MAHLREHIVLSVSSTSVAVKVYEVAMTAVIC
jgi:hypothetical protein